jgi:hypothetical protein
MTGANMEEVAVKGKNGLLTVRSKFQAQNVPREQWQIPNSLHSSSLKKGDLIYQALTHPEDTS